jgi:uncharacterized coiled-coil protein SlyX
MEPQIMPDRRHETWSFDKKIPVALVLAILAQCAAFIVWGARLDSRVQSLENRFAEQQAQLQQANLPDRITRMEVQQSFSNQILSDMSKDVKVLSTRGYRVSQ